jgi:hypothetical protein
MDTVIPVDTDWNEDFRNGLNHSWRFSSVPSNVAGHPYTCNDLSV